jgi:hypothetical protein
VEEGLVRLRRLLRHGDMMRLNIEDKELRLALGNGGRIDQLRSAHSKTSSVDCIHGRKGQGHPAPSAQKLTPIHSGKP